MFVRIVAKAGGPPDGDADGEVIWTGGHVSSADSSGLPASILSAMNPEFEIGTWYSYEAARSLLTGLALSESAAWTTLSITQDGPERAFETKIEVDEEGAAKLISGAILGYCDRIKGLTLWVRID